MFLSLSFLSCKMGTIILALMTWQGVEGQARQRLAKKTTGGKAQKQSEATRGIIVVDGVLATCEAQCWERHTRLPSDFHSSPGAASGERYSHMSWAWSGGGLTGSGSCRPGFQS